MMRMTRAKEPPALLAERAAQWTADYVEKKRVDPAHKFRWPEVNHGGRRAPLNQYLLQELLPATAHHCAYCDSFPFRQTSPPTIDHFRPKGLVPFLHLVFDWENLFPACNECQGRKRDTFDDKLLKPDEASYNFDRYFDFNAKTGEIEPNPQASPHDQERARFTIAIFGLNIAERCASRRYFFQTEYHDVICRSRVELDDLPYRYLAEPPP